MRLLTAHPVILAWGVLAVLVSITGGGLVSGTLAAGFVAVGPGWPWAQRFGLADRFDTAAVAVAISVAAAMLTTGLMALLDVWSSTGALGVLLLVAAGGAVGPPTVDWRRVRSLVGRDRSRRPTSTEVDTASTGRLMRNAYTLMLNTGLSSVLGMAYWMVAARIFSSDDVGVGAAVVTAMVTLAGVSQLNLTVALPRVLPAARAQARQLVRQAAALTLAVGAAIGTLFALGAPLVSDSFSVLRGPLAVVFIGGVALWGLFSLQDGVFIATRDTRWVPIKNVAFGVAKLVAVAVLAGVGTESGILLSWALPMAALVAVSWVVQQRVTIPGFVNAAPSAPTVRWSRTWLRFLSLDYAASLLRLADATFLPLFVVARLGESANAHFFAAFSLAVAVDQASMHVATSLTVEGAHAEDDVVPLTRRALRRTLTLLVPLVVVFLVAAEPILLVFGREYADEGAGVLRMVALAMLPRVVIAIYGALLRVRYRVEGILVAQAASTVLLVVASIALAGPLGIDGIGLAWFLANTAIAAGVALALHRELRSARPHTATATVALTDGSCP